MKFVRFTAVLTALLLLVVGVVAPTTAQEGSPLTDSLPAEPLIGWMQMLRERVQADRFNPPAAARVYAYAGITAYEALYPGMSTARSMAFQVNGLEEGPAWDAETTYDWLSVMDTAMHTVLTSLFAGRSEESFTAFDMMLEDNTEARTEAVGADVVAVSHEYGQQVGNFLLEWISDDRYDRSQEEKATYTLITAEELNLSPDDDYLYVRTNEELPIVEPRWGVVRTLGMDDRYECIVQNPVQFSIAEDSVYYAQAMETFEIGNNLTEEQREIAEFWIDTPGVSSTPAGHWVSIIGQIVDQYDLTLDRAAMLYGMVGVVLHDSFVVGFGIKYETLTMRPQTYIQRHISQRWTSYLVTPQFPEYPSNHSVVSVAAADILTSILGPLPFTDYTAEESLGYVRSFTTFEQAADEAAISRIYGGIHYRTAVELGKRIGQCVAEQALDNITLNPVLQGE